MSDLTKPTRRTFEPRYDWTDIVRYVEHRHGVELCGYKRDLDGEYRDFWHWIVERAYPVRGGFFRLPEPHDSDEAWVKEIHALIVGEFPDGKTEDVWVDW